MTQRAGQAQAVTIVGAGPMASTLARRLLERGHDMTVWNRTRKRVQELERAGAKAPDSLRDAVASSGVVILNLRESAIARKLVDDPEVTRALDRRTVVQLSTGTPSETQEFQEWAGKNGVDFIWGAIQCHPEDIGTEEAYVAYAGDPEVFERHRTLLEEFGGKAEHVDRDARRAAARDHVRLAFYYGAKMGFYQCVAMAEAEGLDINEVAESTIEYLRLLEGENVYEGKCMAARDYPPDHGVLSTEADVVGQLVRSCDELGVPNSFLAAIHTIMEDARASGYNEHDMSSASEPLRTGRRK